MASVYKAHNFALIIVKWQMSPTAPINQWVWNYNRLCISIIHHKESISVVYRQHWHNCYPKNWCRDYPKYYSSRLQ